MTPYKIVAYFIMARIVTNSQMPSYQDAQSNHLNLIIGRAMLLDKPDPFLYMAAERHLATIQ
jgi:hypothetical protein